MNTLLTKAIRWLSQDHIKAIVSIVEYFICGWLVLTGLQSIAGYAFNGDYASDVGSKIILLYAGLIFISTGISFLAVKVRGLIKYHANTLLFTYFLFGFAFITEIMVVPGAVGIWFGTLLLAITTGLFYLRFKLLTHRRR